MEYIKKQHIDTILKLSIIFLAIAGIYYFITTAQLQSNKQITNQTTKNTLSASEEIAWKQKCIQIGEDYFKNLQLQYPPFTDLDYNGFTISKKNNSESPEFAYNSSLNTCLISYRLIGPGPAGYLQGPQTTTSVNEAFKKWGTETQYYIDDSLTKRLIYRWTDDSGAIPPQKNNGTYLDWSLREQALMVNNSK